MKLFYNFLMMGGFCAAMLGASVNASAEGYYPINPDKDAVTTSGQTNRVLNGFKLVSPEYGTQEVSVENPEAKVVYNDLTDKVFVAKPGETLSFVPGFGGTWMHSYLYIDLDNNGQFEPNLTSNGTRYVSNSNSELVSWSILTLDGSRYGYNTTGQRWDLNSVSNIDLPDYTLPADLAPGTYRMRLKIDWNNQDPAGSSSILNDGGYFADMLLVVSEPTETVNVTVADVENGSVVAENGEAVPSTLPFGGAYTAKAVAAEGYVASAVKVTSGYFDGPDTYNDNPLHRVNTIGYREILADGTFTIPAGMMVGDVTIEGVFVEEGTLPQKFQLEYNLVFEDDALTEKVIATANMGTVCVGDKYPTHDWGTALIGSQYYEIESPEGNVVEDDSNAPVKSYLLHKDLPFDPSNSLNPGTKWYNMTIHSSNKYYLIHEDGLDHIELGSTTKPDDDNANAQWAFVGNAFEGFKICNRAAGNGYILSSTTSSVAGSDEGGSVYPHMMAEESLPADYNTYWVPAKSSYATDGWFMYQKGFTSNKLNRRGQALAYWTGGADAGSTIQLSYVNQGVAGVDVIEAEQEFDYNEAVYYTLQGVRVDASQLVPGIYIAKNGVKTVKVLVK